MDKVTHKPHWGGSGAGFPLHADKVTAEKCVQVQFCGGDECVRAEVMEGAEAARAAAVGHASMAAQRSGSGTGETLRSNFVVVADTVMEQDGHLLSDNEKAMITRFKVCC